MKVTIKWGDPVRGFVTQEIPKNIQEVVVVLSKDSEVVHWYGIGRHVFKRGARFIYSTTVVEEKKTC